MLGKYEHGMGGSTSHNIFFACLLMQSRRQFYTLGRKVLVHPARMYNLKLEYSTNLNVKRQIRKYYMSILNTGKSLQQERIRLPVHKFADKIYHTTRPQP